MPWSGMTAASSRHQSTIHAVVGFPRRRDIARVFDRPFLERTERLEQCAPRVGEPALRLHRNLWVHGAAHETVALQPTEAMSQHLL
ncbi:hypothetical protein ASC63_10850 [Leifsonia sp. Root112D2]|nr:hypothetical protein ASC63_10850 [Leifsonia sp. Root112D2]